MESLKKNTLLIFTICVSVVTVIFMAIMFITIPPNNTKIVTQLIYKQLDECNEKLAVYGEDIVTPVNKNEVKNNSR